MIYTRKVENVKIIDNMWHLALISGQCYICISHYTLDSNINQNQRW